MSFLVRGVTRFWSGTGRKPPPLNKHPPPWPAPRPNHFRPTPPPKPTTLAGKVKSYIPSRRWQVFGGLIAAWIALAAYDKRERQKRVKEWCRKVEFLSRREIGIHDTIPSVGVWISAPPGDHVKWNREVWRDYVKPIIVAAGFDYSLHIYQRQGHARTRMREIIKEHRLKREAGGNGEEIIRENEGGDVIVLGRNTFKEIVRGIHEGYLLHLDYVPPAPPAPPVEESKEGEQKPPPEPNPVVAAIPMSEYPSLPDPSDSTPNYTLTYIPSLHILGIRHTPRRIYRFLTRRYVADEICSQVVAAILEQSQREWTEEDSNHGQQEEKFWPKTVAPDAEWREPVILDPRIRPKLLWRQPSPVEEIPDYRQESAPEDPVVRVQELVPTEEELERDRLEKAQSAASKLFTTPNPFGRRG